jgi:hypothetical protein
MQLHLRPKPPETLTLGVAPFLSIREAPMRTDINSLLYNSTEQRAAASSVALAVG